MVALTNIFFASFFAMSALQQAAGAVPATMCTAAIVPSRVAGSNQNQASLAPSYLSSSENSTGLIISNTPTPIDSECSTRLDQGHDTLNAESAYEKYAVGCARAGFGARSRRIVSAMSMQPGSFGLMGAVFAASWWPCVVLASKF